MKLRKHLGLMAAALLIAQIAAGANTINVAPGTGLGGTTYALRCVPDNGTDRAYVQSDEPTAETVFRVEFRILAEIALRDDLDFNRVLTLGVAFGNNVPSRNLLIGIQRAALNPNNFRFWVYARNNNTGRLFPYVVFNFTPSTDNRAMVEWVAGTSPGSDDGIVRVYKNGNMISERTDIPGDGQDIERIRFGLPVGSANTGTTGAGGVLLDEFAMFRTLAP
jgi:hypothetical protein